MVFTTNKNILTRDISLAYTEDFACLEECELKKTTLQGKYLWFVYTYLGTVQNI